MTLESASDARVRYDAGRSPANPRACLGPDDRFTGLEQSAWDLERLGEHGSQRGTRTVLRMRESFAPRDDVRRCASHERRPSPFRVAGFTRAVSSSHREPCGCVPANRVTGSFPCSCTAARVRAPMAAWPPMLFPSSFRLTGSAAHRRRRRRSFAAVHGPGRRAGGEGSGVRIPRGPAAVSGYHASPDPLGAPALTKPRAPGRGRSGRRRGDPARAGPGARRPARERFTPSPPREGKWSRSCIRDSPSLPCS